MPDKVEIPDNWFETTARANFEHFFLPISNPPRPLRHLQIGAFTGNASVWLMENVLVHEDSVLVDVDTWDGGDSPELARYDFDVVEQLYDKRTEPWQWWPIGEASKGKLHKHKAASFGWFTRVGINSEPFDFIYIDGDHRAISCLEDGVMAYRCLKPGGLLCFDDYGWRSKYGFLYEPTAAIDMMKVLYADRLMVLKTGSQCWMKRVDAEERR